MLTIAEIQAKTSHTHTHRMFNDHTTHSLYNIIVTATTVMGVMRMGNIAPRAGIEPTSLAFQVSVLTMTSPRHTDFTTVPPSMWLLP